MRQRRECWFRQPRRNVDTLAPLPARGEPPRRVLGPRRYADHSRGRSGQWILRPPWRTASQCHRRPDDDGIQDPSGSHVARWCPDNVEGRCLYGSIPLGACSRVALWLDFIDSVEEIDPRHVAIHLKSPLTLNNVIMVQFISILPAHSSDVSQGMGHSQLCI